MQVLKMQEGLFAPSQSRSFAASQSRSFAASQSRSFAQSEDAKDASSRRITGAGLGYDHGDRRELHFERMFCLTCA